MGKIRQILVDLDGTLLGARAIPLNLEFIVRSIVALRPLGGVRRAFRGLRAIQSEISAGRPTTPDELNDIRIVRRFVEVMGLSPEDSRKHLRDGLLQIFPPLQRHFFPLPGAKEFLDWAHSRYPLVLATNPVWPPEIIEMRVKWAGIDPTLFRSVTHIRTMKATKPSPEYYRQILAMEGFDPVHTLLVGNEERMDLPATKVGITVFLVGGRRATQPMPIPASGELGWRGSFPQLRELLETRL